MVTDAYSQSADLASTLFCPQCQTKVEAWDVACPACGVDLAWAAAQAEREVLASVAPAVGQPQAAEIPLPRFGEYLLRRGYVTREQLSAALTRQREAAGQGVSQIIGQTLFDMGVVSREQLDKASVEQAQELKDALQAARQHLENSVADRTRLLQQALQQLGTLSELRANLTGNLVHSLRSPVVPIRGYGSMLVEERLGPLTDPQREAVEIILRCVNQLETAINEMSQLSAAFKGQVHLRPTRVSVPEMAERLKHLFTPRAEAAQVRLRLDAAPDLPWLSADPEKIWWALYQLFDQALKAMPQGGELALTVSAAEGKATFCVQDTAPGLSLAQREEILRLPPEFISRLADSRGWSLAQVKRIMDAHGARFTIESQPEQGTTIWFELPLVSAP